MILWIARSTETRCFFSTRAVAYNWQQSQSGVNAMSGFAAISERIVRSILPGPWPHSHSGSLISAIRGEPARCSDVGQTIPQATACP